MKRILVEGNGYIQMPLYDHLYILFIKTTSFLTSTLFSVGQYKEEKVGPLYV